MPLPPALPFDASHALAMAAFDGASWEQTLALGRLHGIAGRWHRLLDHAQLIDQVPAPVRKHLWSEHLMAADRERMARWEANRINHAFRDVSFPIVLLKGAAYILCGLPPGDARIVADVDILVPHSCLADAEQTLNRHGWRKSPKSDYDEHYYREWMHEIPPMQHGARGAVLDVHHNILPRTSRLCPNAADLIDNTVDVPASRLKVFAPADMVLHSVVHGFHSGEFGNCFRDLLDVHELVSHFANHSPTFWAQLLTRVHHFRFERPTFYALRYCVRHLGTTVPSTLMQELAPYGPPLPLLSVMDWAIARVFLPTLPPTLVQRAALQALYIRSHWIKMPPVLLTRHLWTKYRMRRGAASDTAQ
ncbi:MAG: nucleotidyltransferase family protein [Gammaproteobacteria bacterium]|nr:nucleotidyltransferase family protein [Gammaproteobacteria bacterium]